MQSFWTLLHLHPRSYFPWAQCKQGNPLRQFERYSTNTPSAPAPATGSLRAFSSCRRAERRALVWRRGYRALVRTQEQPPSIGRRGRLQRERESSPQRPHRCAARLTPAWWGDCKMEGHSGKFKD